MSNNRNETNPNPKDNIAALHCNSLYSKRDATAKNRNKNPIWEDKQK